MLLTADGNRILESSRERGWVLEPDAKKILAEAGLTVPRFHCAAKREDAFRDARDIGYPLVAKIVSPEALHKSDVGGVVVGLDSEDQLGEVFDRFSRFEGFLGVHLEEMIGGVELIAGAKMDPQFGPVILLGIGGTSVEIYQDTAIRMAPPCPERCRIHGPHPQSQAAFGGLSWFPAGRHEKTDPNAVTFFGTRHGNGGPD